MVPSEYSTLIKLCNKPVRGYRIFYDPKHPLANSCGWVYEHRHIVSLKVGRWLLSEEQVHHIDGDKVNNSPDNLEILSRKDHAHKHFGTRKEYSCKKCGKLSLNESYCSTECRAESQQKIFISKDELSEIVWSAPMAQLSEELGISDSAIRKRCKKFGINLPPSGYWLSRNSGKNHQEAMDQLKKNENYKPLPPKFTREQLLFIIISIKKDFVSLREIGRMVNSTHHPIMQIKNKLINGKIEWVFKYYKAGEVPGEIIKEFPC